MNRNTLLVLGVAAVAVFLLINPLRFFRGGGSAMRRPVAAPAGVSPLSAWAEKPARPPEDYMHSVLRAA